MKKLLTIVIPSYNMEKYLDKCLNSLIVGRSLWELLEILIINDGSGDGTSTIAHNYEKRYPQLFRIIDKENGNYGSCINRALKEATGKYIKVLDADDFFQTKEFETFLFSIREINVDLILSDFTIVFSNGQQPSYRTLNIPSFRPLQFDDVALKICGVQMHAITYRTQLLRDINYTQSEGISYTDTEWALLPMKAVDKIFYIDKSIYQYNVGREGQTMNVNTYLNRRSQIFQINSRLLNDFVCLEDISKDRYFFYYNYFRGFYRRWYYMSIIERKYPDRELVAIDNELKTANKELWEDLGKEKFGNLIYIYIWRKSNRFSRVCIVTYVYFKKLFSIIKKLYVPISRINAQYGVKNLTNN